MSTAKESFFEAKEKNIELLLSLRLADLIQKVNDRGNHIDFRKIDEVYPIISEDLIRNSISALSISWELKTGESRGSNFLKTKIKRMMLYLVHWIYAPVIKQQSENNLRYVRILDLLSTFVLSQTNRMHGSKCPDNNVIASLSDMSSTSNLDELIMVFRYIQLIINPSAQLLCIIRKPIENLYHDYIMSIVHELGVNNIQFFYDPEPIALHNYLSLSDVILSRSENDNWLSYYPELSSINIPFVVASKNVFNALGANAVYCREASISDMASLVVELMKNMRIRELLAG